MNKRRSAFSLIEAMIILVLISVAVMALVPLISQKTNSTWMVLNDNGRNYLTYGEKVNQHVGFSIGEPQINEGKLVASSAAIAYNSNDANKSINFGQNCDAAGANCRTIRANVDTTNKIRIGENACANAANSINISSVLSQADNDVANSCFNLNTIQIGNNNGTGIIQRNNNETIFRINNRNVIRINNNDIDINLPDGTQMFNNRVTAAGAEVANTVTFFQNVTVNGDITFTKALTEAQPDPIDPPTPNYVCKGPPAFIHLESTNESVCHWFCTASAYFSAGADSSICTINGGVASDKRLKNIKSDYKKGFDTLKQIDTYLYTFKSDKAKRIHAGLIAQKLKGVLDEALHTNEEGYYSYEKEPVLYAIVNSIKEIFSQQNNILKEQKKSNRKADKLLRKYSQNI